MKVIPGNRLDNEVERIISKMEETDLDSKEYVELQDKLDKLIKIKNDKRLISWGDGLAISANILGILAVINHERIGIITTKALGLVRKGRV